MTYSPVSVEQSKVHSLPFLNKPRAHVTHCVLSGPQHPVELSHSGAHTKPSAADGTTTYIMDVTHMEMHK